MVSTPAFDHAGRIARLRAAMESEGVEAVLLSAGADLSYFTGYAVTSLERPTVAVVRLEHPLVLWVPALEEPRVTVIPDLFELRPWADGEDPIGLVAAELAEVRRLALTDQTWASAVLALQAALPGARFRAAGLLTGSIRMVKDQAELTALRRAGAAADRVVEHLAATRFSQRRERDLAAEIADLLVLEGHQTADFTIVASGPNSASPHHEAGERVMERGDVVVVDFGGRLNGYSSDTTRTFVVGRPSPEVEEVFELVGRAQQAGVEAVRPGVPAESVDRAARAVIEAGGRGDRFLHRTGHGIGLEVHEHPYLVAGNRQALEPGMTFSVEPGVYLPGRFGVRIEDIVTVTSSGVERLNRSPRTPILVD